MRPVTTDLGVAACLVEKNKILLVKCDNIKCDNRKLKNTTGKLSDPANIAKPLLATVGAAVGS